MLTPQKLDESAALTVDDTSLCFNGNAAKQGITIKQSIEWTDEKHNRYLGYLEASFVNQLRGSTGLFGTHSEQRRVVDPNSIRKIPSNTCNSPDQFTVLHSGRWKKRKFETDNPSVNVAHDSRVVSQSLPIRHFRSASKLPIDVSSDVQEKSLPSSIRFPVPTLLKGHEQLDAGNQDFDTSVSEGSDQNFEDDDQGNQPSDSSVAKKLQVESADPSINDQVVPSQATTTANNTHTMGEARASQQSKLHQFVKDS